MEFEVKGCEILLKLNVINLDRAEWRQKISVAQLHVIGTQGRRLNGKICLAWFTFATKPNSPFVVFDSSTTAIVVQKNYSSE